MTSDKSEWIVQEAGSEAVMTELVRHLTEGVRDKVNLADHEEGCVLVFRGALSPLRYQIVTTLRGAFPGKVHHIGYEDDQH